jgi:hypothetical protein
VTSLLRVELADKASACAVQVSEPKELQAALGMLGLQPPRSTVVVVGGAAGLRHLDRLRPAFVEAIAPVMEKYGAVGVDGGTRSGVMRLFGEARAATRATFPMVGVVATGAVQHEHDHRRIGTMLEPHHTGFVFVPGKKWGAEAPWIARTATAIAATAPSITVLVNGGQIAYTDVKASVQSGRPVVVVAGSGRTADVFVKALAGAPADARAATLVRSGLIRSVPAGEPAALAEVLAAILSDALAN